MENTAAAAALPDDLIEEILIRVDDAAALFRCTTVCKPWFTMVSKPAYLHRHWPDDSAESFSLFGFFAPKKKKYGEEMFVPAPRSPLIGRCSLSSFFPEFADLLEVAEPITSRRGLLLVLLHHCDPAGGIRLAVCNPLAGTCDVLPPLYCIDTFFDRGGCAILTGADLSSEEHQDPLPGYSTFFKLIICCGYGLYMFPSNEWDEPWEDHLHIKDLDLELVGSAVVCRGMVHWLLGNTSDYYALQVSADTGEVVSFTQLWLDRSNVAWFHEIGTPRTLSLLVLNYRGNDLEIQVWRRGQDGESTAADQWLSTGIIHLARPKKTNLLKSLVGMIKPRRSKQINHKVGTLSGALIFIDKGLHVADLTTGAMEDVTAQFRGLDAMVYVPFEASWADFFSSRLGPLRS